MPERNGLDLSRALLTHPRLIVLLLSSTNIGLDLDQLHEHGIEATLRKPLRRCELYDVLCGAISNKNAPPKFTGNESHSENEETQLRGHILIAEDNTINQMYMTELMNQINCTCDTVANGLEATEAVQQRSYDLVLMDCQMPEMDGFDATLRIRELESNGTMEGHLPIIALTANAVKGDRERCLAAGMDEYLAKPVQKEQIATMFAQFLGEAEQPNREAAFGNDQNADRIHERV
jgi:Amt family ammonium transporter